MNALEAVQCSDNAGICRNESERRCDQCFKPFCLIHLHPSHSGIVCTWCLSLLKYKPGGVPMALSAAFLTARLASTTARTLRYTASVILATKGDTADDQGAHYRNKAHRHIVEAAEYELGAKLLLDNIQLFEEVVDKA